MADDVFGDVNFGPGGESIGHRERKKLAKANHLREVEKVTGQITNGHDKDYEWPTKLRRGGKQDALISGSVENAGLFLENHQEIAGRLQFNAFTVRAVVTRPMPWDNSSHQIYPRELTDSDAMNFCRWLERQTQYGVSKDKAFGLLGSVAEANPIHPLQDYLSLLEWDGQERIENWLTYYLGVEQSDYAKAVGFRFLIGAVARALQPGCKMDTMLVFEGNQGIGKSTAARVLFGDEYFTDSLSPVGTKDQAQELGGKWCIEIAEMAQFLKADQRHVKETLSRCTDRYRPPYGRMPREFPRHCVFIGTYNPSSNAPLKDETGARRFWPVKCEAVDLDALKNDRDQIWAEAVHRFKGGERWWLEGEEVDLAVIEQEARYDEDVWEPLIADHLAGVRSITIPSLLEKMGFKPERMGKPEQMRAATCLRRLGFDKTTKWTGGKAIKIWELLK